MCVWSNQLPVVCFWSPIAIGVFYGILGRVQLELQGIFGLSGLHVFNVLKDLCAEWTSMLR